MLIHLAMMLSKVSGSGFPSDDTAHLPLSSLLAANTPVPTINGRRLASKVFTKKAKLKKAVSEYNADKNAAIEDYGPISLWDVSGITDMSGLFKNLKTINEDISSWNTSSVETMDDMFKARALAPTALACMPLTHRSRPPPCRLSPHLPPPCMTSLTTRQNAKKFNKPLDFVTSNVISMAGMFRVRALVPTSSRKPFPAIPLAPSPPPPALSPPGPHLALSPQKPTLGLGRTRMPSTSR